MTPRVSVQPQGCLPKAEAPSPGSGTSGSHCDPSVTCFLYIRILFSIPTSLFNDYFFIPPIILNSKPLGVECRWKRSSGPDHPQDSLSLPELTHSHRCHLGSLSLGDPACLLSGQLSSLSIPPGKISTCEEHCPIDLHL